MVSLTAGAAVTWDLPFASFFLLSGATSQFSSFLRDFRKSFIVLGLGRVFLPQKTGLAGETFGDDCFELGRIDNLETGLTVILVVFKRAVVTSPDS